MQKLPKKVLSYLEYGKDIFWASALPSDSELVILEGKKFGIHSASGYIRLSNGKTVLFCYISDNLENHEAVLKLKDNIFMMFYLLKDIYKDK